MNRLTVTPQTKNPTTTRITQISVSHGHRDPYNIFHKELWRIVKEINSLIHVLAERENPLFKGVKTVVEKENLGGFPKPLDLFMKMAMALGEQKAENHREDSERRGSRLRRKDK
ncbi:UNVERIFIED_CONTAM: hypothetical protein Sindi_1286200 [Sesamum indicum]